MNLLESLLDSLFDSGRLVWRGTGDGEWRQLRHQSNHCTLHLTRQRIQNGVLWRDLFSNRFAA